ncbi:MAG: hypothetical protein ACYDDE_00545 [bacterium]
MIKNILMIITLMFIFTASNVYANNTIKVTYQYAGFSGTKVISVNKMAKILVNNLSYNFAKKFPSSKFGFGIYLNTIHHNRYYIVSMVVNIYKYKNGIMGASKAYTISIIRLYNLNYTKRISDIKKTLLEATTSLKKVKHF